MEFGAHIFGRFILFSKSCIGQFMSVLWPVHGLYVWPVYGQFLGSSEDNFCNARHLMGVPIMDYRALIEAFYGIKDGMVHDL